MVILTTLRARWGALLLAMGAASVLYLATPAPAHAQPSCNIGDKVACVYLTGNVSSQTWYSDTIYVLQDVGIPATATVYVEAGTIIKIYTAPILDPDPGRRAGLYITGTLILSGTAGNEVVFTSYRDDTYGGDTNGDDIITQPLPGDYREIRITQSSHNFHDAIVRYGYYGLRVYNDGGSAIAPPITNVNFNNNYFGLMLWTAKAGDITSTVSDCTFSYNLYGLGTGTAYPATTTAIGASRPYLANNTFHNHDENAIGTGFTSPSFPIYLDGTGFPTYSGNTFASTNRHSAIALGGHFLASGTWEKVPVSTQIVPEGYLPYVVYGNVVGYNLPGYHLPGYPPSGTQDVPNRYADFHIYPSSTITVPAGTIFKFYYDPARPAALRYMHVGGRLDLGSADNNRVVFTSYRDDTYGGDTNNDGNTNPPALDNWHSVIITNSTTTVDYTLFRYARAGLQIANWGAADIAPAVLSNTFEYNKSGVYLLIGRTGVADILSTIQGSLFVNNTYGLHTDIYTRALPILPSGASRPVVIDNQFNLNTGFPVFLNGTGFPTYNNNTFSGNIHLAIGLGGYFMNSGAWELVNGSPQQNVDIPYAVALNTVIGPVNCVNAQNQPVPCADVDTVTVLPNTIFKFDTSKGLTIDAYGDLDLTSTSAADRVVFTSYKDDTYGGDTNADGAATTPAKSNWHAVVFSAKQLQPVGLTKQFAYALVKYSAFGVRVEYEGPASGNFLPEVANSTFEENGYGAYLFIKSSGDINSSIHDNLFKNNVYGLGTGISSPSVIGVSRPLVYGNAFDSHTQFPIVLGGSAFPVYSSTTNVFVNNGYPAVALGGTFNCGGQNCTGWNEVYNGNTGIRLPYVVITDVVIGVTTTVNLPAGTIVKFKTIGCTGANQGGRCAMTVNGELAVQGTPSDPVIFTSFKDDSSGGDTNNDGSATTPSRTDWYALTLASSGLTPPAQGGYTFDYAVIKYALAGLRIRASSAANVSPPVANNTFTENGVGLSFLIEGAGNIFSPVSNNIFLNNNGAVQAAKTGSNTGQVLSAFSGNDFYGSKTTGNGITVTVGNNTVVTVTGNYWGSPTGPFHATLNPSGQGVVVTNTVGNTIILDTWGASPNQAGLTYAIQGRVELTGSTPLVPLPLAGVTLLLNTGAFTTTTQTGDYNFYGLSGGTYVVQPLLSGYTFNPVTRTVMIAGSDGNGVDFIATPVVGTRYNVSGQVRDQDGNPLADVLVCTLEGSAAALTDAAGNYTLSLLPGMYTLKAVKSGYAFAPVTRSVTVVDVAITGQNFQEATYVYLPLIKR